LPFCYLFASVIVYYGKATGAFLAGLILLLLYWLLAYTLGDAADPYSLQGYFGTAVDKALLGEHHLYRGEGIPFDPEGLASTCRQLCR
jgi:predicted acyltransferase